jgi:hypothetical protein
MFARLITKALLAAIAAGAAFFGAGLLGFALAHQLVAFVGVAGAYAIAGGALLLLALILALIVAMTRPRKAPPPQQNELTRVLLAAVAKEVPWVAIVGAGLAGAASMFLNRNKSSK